MRFLMSLLRPVSLRPGRRRLAQVVALAAVSATSTMLAPIAADAAVAVPRAALALPAAIEDMPAYQPQIFCDPVNKPGPVALGALLTSTYRDTTVVGISRACGTDTSEHYEGRALDWGAYYKNAQQVKEVQAVFSWLFAKDAAGNPNAMLRRLGIMYIIWNKQIWGSWSQKWEPYSCSGVTACHQDHVHFSFDWAGAEKKTSFWTGKVSGYVAPPAYTYTSTKFAQITKVSARSTTVTTPFRVKAGVPYRMTVTGTYRTAALTAAAPNANKADAECSTSDGKTWRALAPGDVSSMTGRLDLWVERHRYWAAAPSTGGGCSATKHSYTRTLTFPTTGPLHFFVNDTTRGDDSGSLSVTIQRV
jgi:hypothetical protein